MASPGEAIDLRLDGLPALVSGGGSGIGKAIARTFAAAGARVAIGGRRREVLEAAAGEITEETGGQVLAVQGDVTRVSDCQRMVEGTAERFGGLRILVNNAGVAKPGALEDTSEAQIDSMVDIDLKGPILLTRAALDPLKEGKEAGGSSVLNISSSVTLHPVPSYSVYSAAKAGLDMLTRCWALDLAPWRVRVNAICPGIVRTPVFRTMMPEDQIEPTLERFGEATPLGRIGEPEDVARLALFLVSPASSWMTAAVIPLDGGLSLVSA